jgi:methylenetetrahydrofolate reductase (NADH)
MSEVPIVSSEDRARYEVLPVEGIDERAAELPRPVRLTVTCSPVTGPDRAVEMAVRLRQLGHAVTVHLAARMVRDQAHLDALLAAIEEAGGDDVFLIGGDIRKPVGEYSSAVELIPMIDKHPRRPPAIGIAAYPEDHPLISDEALERALREKSRYADYVVTQMCFDAERLRRWVVRHRELGIELPVLIGMPGKVRRRQLLKMSARIGVGPSLRFLRKQRGLRSLLSRRSSADRLYEAIAPMLEEPALKLAGFQYFTFNALIETWEWHQHKLDRRKHTGGQAARAAHVRPQERTTREESKA